VVKFQITGPEKMAKELFTLATCKIINKLITKKTIKLYTEFVFSEYEAAACKEFILQARPYNKSLTMDIPGVVHKLSPSGLDDNFFGIITIVLSENADTFNTAAMELAK
jgi:hypothetical protein